MSSSTFYWLCYKGETKIGPFSCREDLLEQLALITCNSYKSALKSGGWSIRRTRSTKQP
jgi:hypothetical protein